MIGERNRNTPSTNTQASLETFREDVLRGLLDQPKHLPCKYFYDESGSELFEEITRLNEYYPTRTEQAIMDRNVPAMAAMLGPRCAIVEFGSGSSTKTRALLDHLEDPVAYVPVDLSSKHLFRAAGALADEYPSLEVKPLFGDFTKALRLPVLRRAPRRTIVYFPGSTIGNFTASEATSLLKLTADLCGAGGGMLLGADLRKNVATLERAYNDFQGVTAAFNRNLLVRINRELGADFDLDHFEHRADFNSIESRIEMHLVSQREQQVNIAGTTIAFHEGESIHTENSYKYTLQDLSAISKAGGFEIVKTWTDQAQYFSVSYLSVRAHAGNH